MGKFSQRGGLIVEFVLILPLFLLIMFLILYGGIYLHDVNSLNEMARSAVRYAVVVGDEDSSSSSSATGTSDSETKKAARLQKVRTRLAAHLRQTPLILFKTDTVNDVTVVIDGPNDVSSGDSGQDKSKMIAVTLTVKRKPEADAAIPLLIEMLELIPQQMSSSMAMRLEVE